MSAKPRGEHGKFTITATGDVTPGVLKVENGLVSVVEGVSGGSEPGLYKAGDVYMANYLEELEVTAPSALVAAGGDKAFVNLTTQEAIASGGGGAVLAGIYSKPKLSGETTAWIALNAPGYDA